MLVSERRELLLKCLRESFGDESFTAKDVISAKTFGCFDLKDALEANFGTKVLNLKSGLITIKIGRLLEQKCLGKTFGHYEVRIAGRGEVNKYRVLGPPVVKVPLFATRPAPVPPPILPCPPPYPPALRKLLPPVLTIKTVDSVGKVHSEILRDRNGEPLRDTSTAPAEPPKPVAQLALPRSVRIPKICIGGKWREMTAEEYEASTSTQRILGAAAVHPGHMPLQQIGRVEGFGYFPGHSAITPHNSRGFDL
jgi:hypothetical protein